MINDCITHISKSGGNLFAKVPANFKNDIGRGDRVKIIVLEKNTPKNPDKIKQEIKEFIKNPNGERLKGTIIGYNIDLPWTKLIKLLSSPKKDLEKALYNFIVKT